MQDNVINEDLDYLNKTSTSKRSVVQLQLLNKVIQDKNYALIEDNNLTADFFPENKAEFNYIRDFYTKYHTVPDRLTFKSVFDTFRFENVDIPNEYLVSQLFKEYKTDLAVSKWNLGRDAVINGNEDAIYQMAEEILKTRDIGAPMNCIDLTSDTSRLEHFKERCNNKENSYMSTGFLELDKMIGGIDRLNENMVIAARPGVGKSWILLALAGACYRQGFKVGIYSGEMHEDKVGFRLDTFLGHISNKALNRGDSLVLNAYEEYMKELTSGSLATFNPYTGEKGFIKVVTPSMIDGGSFATINNLRNFIRREHLDILFIDQYSLINDVSNAKQENERVGHISRAIKELQVLEKIPVISVSQLNRKASEKDKDTKEDVEQDVSQLSMSDKIGQDATIVIMLSKRPVDPEKNTVVNKIEPGKLYTRYQFTFNVTKARDGGEGKLNYLVDLDTFECIADNTGPSKLKGDCSEDDLEESDYDEYYSDDEADDLDI